MYFVLCISNTYFIVTCILNTIWKLVQFYWQNGKFEFRTTLWGLKSITDMPNQFELITKLMLDFLLVIIEFV